MFCNKYDGGVIIAQHPQYTLQNVRDLLSLHLLALHTVEELVLVGKGIPRDVEPHRVPVYTVLCVYMCVWQKVTLSVIFKTPFHLKKP